MRNPHPQYDHRVGFLPSSKRVLGPQYEELERAMYPLTELAALASHFDQLTLWRVGGLTLARQRGSVAELATLEMPRGTLHLPLTRSLGCRLAGMSSRSRLWTTFFLAIGELVDPVGSIQPCRRWHRRTQSV